MNYLFAILAYLVARRIVRRGARGSQRRNTSAAIKLAAADRRRRHGRGLAREPQDARAPCGHQAGEARRRPAGDVRSAFSPRGERDRGAAVAAHRLPVRLRHDTRRAALLRDGAARRHQPADAGHDVRPAARIARRGDSRGRCAARSRKPTKRRSCTAISSRRT